MASSVCEEKERVALEMNAKQFAIEAHGDQHYGTGPYVTHLQAVHGTLVEFGYTDEDLLAAAWLHDVIEDTQYGFGDIHREFGLRIALIVDGVTDEPKGGTRADRHKWTYPKIATDQCFVILKLADRIANMRESEKTSPGLLNMYRREYPEFRKALKDPWGVIAKYLGNPKGLSAMWAEMDRLSKDRNGSE